MWPRSQSLIFMLFCVTRVKADFFGEKKELVYDLLQATVASTDDTLYMDDGLDGFPVFGFRPGSEVKQPYRLYLPEKLPADFTLVAIFKPTSFTTSYLFAVLNPFETVVQLGIRISDGPGTNQNVSLIYTNSDMHSHSEEVAKFTVPKLTKKWSKIVIRVSPTDVTLYLNCHELARQRVTRIPLELEFGTASTLYIGQAGPHIQERYDFIQRNQHKECHRSSGLSHFNSSSNPYTNESDRLNNSASFPSTDVCSKFSSRVTALLTDPLTMVY